MRRTNSMQTILRVVVRELRETQLQVDALKRRIRWLAIVAVIGVVIIGFFVFLLLSPYKIVTASQYTILDEAGNDRLILGPSTLTLLDAGRRPRVRLGLELDDTPELTFYDESQGIRSVFGLRKNGLPYLQFYDAGQQCRGNLGLDSEGNLRISLFDGQGNPIESFDLYPNRSLEKREAGTVSDVTQ